tara:strand:- start:191 stop:463 length:273 start_codon:yes stop_codon:yes gene_type:complete
MLYNMLFANIPGAKVANLDLIAEASGVQRRACVLLVDDRPENIAAACRSGYHGVLVNERTGITRPVAQDIIATLRRCRDEWDERLLSSSK